MMKMNPWVSALAVTGALVSAPLFAAGMSGHYQSAPQTESMSQQGQEQQDSMRMEQQKSWTSQQASLDAVRDLQQALKDAGYYQDGKVDGLIGPQTTSALRQFQQDQGLVASGEVTAQTLSALKIDQSEFAAFGVEPTTVSPDEADTMKKPGMEEPSIQNE